MKHFSERFYLWLCLPVVYFRYRRDSQIFQSKVAISNEETFTSSDHMSVAEKTGDSEFLNVREGPEYSDESNEKSELIQ